MLKFAIQKNFNYIFVKTFDDLHMYNIFLPYLKSKKSTLKKIKIENFL